MSPYEILAVAALATAGSVAYWLYRSDTRPRPGAPKLPETGPPMFARDRATKR